MANKHSFQLRLTSFSEHFPFFGEGREISLGRSGHVISTYSDFVGILDLGKMCSSFQNKGV